MRSTAPGKGRMNKPAVATVSTNVALVNGLLSFCRGPGVVCLLEITEDRCCGEHRFDVEVCLLRTACGVASDGRVADHFCVDADDVEQHALSQGCAPPARPADRAAAVRSSPPTTPTLPRTACLRGSAAYGAGDQSSRPALPGHLHRVREEAARPRTPPNSPTTACLASPDWRGCGPSVRPGPESSASQEALLATGQ